MNVKPYRKLALIQQELKAPKDKFNSFGKYKYRSCEGILETLKPILASFNCTIKIMDDVVEKCGKPYVMATVDFIDLDEDESQPITTVAFAREPLDKKGMDDAQITGSVSSYARKYALNAMFLIDDSTDPDTDEYKTTNDTLLKKNAEPAKTAPMPPQVSGEVVSLGKKQELAKESKQENNAVDERRKLVSKIQEMASKENITPAYIDLAMNSLCKGKPETCTFKDYPTPIYKMVIEHWEDIVKFCKQNDEIPFGKEDK